MLASTRDASKRKALLAALLISTACVRMPHARSLTLDAATLYAYRTLRATEPSDKRNCSTLPGLDVAERALFGELRDNVYSQHIRMEPERIGYRWLEDVLGA